jgi:biopolymer transport protein ExbD
VSADSGSFEGAIEYRAEGAKDFETGDFKEMGWKGLVAEVVDIESSESPAGLEVNKAGSADGLDMTPMVDVTFLLLIFFMVTASFVLQKSIEHPQGFDDASSKPVRPSSVVEVQIDKHNVYFVSSDEVEIECPSEREMRSQLKDLQEKSCADRMIIRAHVDSMHNRVVSAWDAGRVAGLEEILFRTTEEEL